MKKAWFHVGLLGPVLDDSCKDVAFVNGFYSRPLDGHPRGGGRVTELAARPAIAILLDHLSPIVQPLAGEFAADRGPSGGAVTRRQGLPASVEVVAPHGSSSVHHRERPPLVEVDAYRRARGE